MNSQLPLGPDAPWLAPLAGFSDLPFRLLCREQGAAVACTEMVSAKGLVYGARQRRSRAPEGGGGGTEELLITTPEDKPLVVQLFGAEPEFMSEAAVLLRDRAYGWFDVNMGCSVPKVTKTGAGAALLREPARAVAVAAAVVRAVGPGRVGCKIRLGWDASSPVCPDLARALEDVGVAWITLHPRYARQMFSGKADASALEKTARAVSIPLLASGDLFSAEDAVRCLERGASGVMFARGAMANPSLFRQYLDLRRFMAGDKGASPLPDGLFQPAFPDRGQLLALIVRHAELARAWTPPETRKRGRCSALLKMRTVVPRYVRHLPGVKRLRLALVHCESWDEFDDIIHGFFSEKYAAHPLAEEGERMECDG